VSSSEAPAPLVQPKWRDLPAGHPHFERFVQKSFEAAVDYLREAVVSKPKEALKFAWLLDGSSEHGESVHVVVVRHYSYLNLLIATGPDQPPVVTGCISVADGAWKLQAVITPNPSISNVYLDIPIDSNYRVPKIRPMRLLYEDLLKKS
jgi:hypothetical protein